MEWNFQLDQESVPVIPPVDETISFESPGEGDFRFDLKLGQMGNNSSNSKPCDSTSRGLMMMNNWKESAGPKSESSMSTKRARANGNANQAVFCLVDGCKYDLSNCREYHRRHKVCEVHSKTPVVTINGINKRFCQQCSRFHSLEEFDEGKRSCRKRLDGHNRRRRKIQPDHSPRSSNFFSDFRGTRYLEFSSSNVFASTSVGNHRRGGVDFIPTTSNRAQSSNSNNAGCKAETAFMFLQDGKASDNNRVTFQRNYSSSLSGGDSDYCALSLLSSPSQTQSSSTVTSIGFNHQNATTQPLAFRSEPSEPVYSSRLFQNASGSDGSVSQAFPFHWE